MSLAFPNAIPRDLEIKSHPNIPGHENETVRIGEYHMSLSDFLVMAEYVLTNTDIVPNDPRVKFLERIKRAEPIPGWNPGNQRIGFPG